MKVRYTSLQVDTGAAEEQLIEPVEHLPNLGGVPVLVGGLHSQIGVVAVVLRALRPDLRVSYVMTDGAALPLALSDLVADLRERGFLAGTVTAGHAFGGELEAVSVPSALHLAIALQHADVVLCAMGPGAVGTNTALGTTSVEVAAILTAAAQLGGRPIAIARASSGDERPRHQSISHHTITSLKLTPTPVTVPVPMDSGLAAHVPRPHRAVEVEVPDVAALLAEAGMTITTMGRGPARDRLFFDVAAAAAVHAAKVAPMGDTVRSA